MNVRSPLLLLQRPYAHDVRHPSDCDQV